jgi:hypothetical protein
MGVGPGVQRSADGKKLISNIKAMITLYWGERCVEVDEGCPCCHAWKMFDADGRFHTFDEVTEDTP